MILGGQNVVVISLICMSLPRLASGYWPFTLPRGGCSNLYNCQDCVVSYSYDELAWIRRPCTWCPGKGTCEMMNEYTGKCDSGDTYRATCPINADLPRCVYLKYSFYVSFSGRPEDHCQCGSQFAIEWCNVQTNER